MKEPISEKHAQEILEKLFSCIGLQYNKSLIEKDNWYQDHDWGKTEYKENFLVWLTEFLIKKKYVPKQRARHEAEKIDAVYGWREIRKS